MSEPAPPPRLRGAGRIGSVAAGAMVAIAFVDAGPATGWYAAAAVAALAGAAGTRGSRWYVTPAFTTFLVFLLLLHARPEDAASRFGERLGETLLGVGIALACGVVVPSVLDRGRRAGVSGS